MTVRRPGRQHGFALAAAVLVADVSSAAAGAFYIPQQGVDGVGRGFAGSAALARSASTVFHNPAAMTELSGPAAEVGANILVLDFQVSDRGSTATTPGTGLVASLYASGPGDNPASPEVVPNLFAAQPFMERRLWLGLGLTAPFGLALEYPSDSFGRYDSIETRLLTLNVGPAVAWRATDWLSVGGGVDIQYAEATLSNAVPFPFAAPTPATDGRAEVDGRSWAVGYNVGVLIKPLATTRIGLHFRSGLNHDFDGALALSGLRAPLAGLNRSVDSTTSIKLPPIATAAIAHEVTPQLTLLGEIQWFGWSRFDDIRIRAEGQPEVLRPQRYDDSFGIAIGAEYQLTDAWRLRGGFLYDRTPIPDAFRNTSVPTGDAYWLAVGAGCKPTPSFEVSLAYAHTFFDDAPINAVSQPFGSALPVTVNVRGTARSRGDTVSLQVRYTF
jgi:long-chain fatty acid transport protein